MKPIWVKTPWLPFGAAAITTWPIIWASKAWGITPELTAHEEYHWRDQKRCWVLPWFAAYFILWPFYADSDGKRGTAAHPLEIGAYQVGWQEATWRTQSR
jgi:hypothetical protein